MKLIVAIQLFTLFTFSTGFLGARRLLEVGGEQLVLLMLPHVVGGVVSVLVVVEPVRRVHVRTASVVK